ncbi:hypothetical protein [Oceanospirillum sanctuarii]|uniref:hypothetical protein n=1 Tax=Oceanospirillum sanctuarii TaxID=1434821 RepID=UPI00111C969E|nr:hypothetical protein [Oceanospirillum sanctuarii]
MSAADQHSFRRSLTSRIFGRTRLKASTTRGSKCLLFCSSNRDTASGIVQAFLYGRSETRASKTSARGWFQEEYTRQFGSMNPELATLFEQVKSVLTGKFPNSPYQLIEIRYEDPEKQNLRLFFEDQREAMPSGNSNKRIIKEKVIPVSPITSDLFEDHWSGNHL